MKRCKRNSSGEKNNATPKSQSRRAFLKSSAILGAGGLVGTSVLAENAEAAPSFQTDRRSREAYHVRVRAAANQLKTSASLKRQRNNGDDRRYAGQNYCASFTKTLPHNQFGEVDPRAYRALLRAAKTGKARHFEAIPLDGTASRRLANPQGAYRFVHGGLDGHATRMRPAPTFRSAEAAAEMGEVYWQGLTRDVPFNHYETDIRIANAVDDLNYGFSETVGPKMSGFVNPMTLFRGPTDGDLTGPYVSQFLWHDIPYGPSVINQRYERPVSHLEFMVDEVNWLNVQRGGAPMETPVFDTDRRYIYDNRGLGEYVHRDVLFQAYFNAGLILLGYGGAAIDSGNPYFNGTISNQGAFTCFGGPYMIDLVTQAGNLALQGAWYQKWLQHRRLRPEVYAGRVHFMMTGKRNYELNSEILNSQAVQHVYSQFGSYLLPMAYTEGSPTHPSYPAGHATVAGACTTMLKAFFNEEFVIPNPVISNDDGTALDSYYGATLTVGGELNKLASNVAIARNAAGVHYRSDGVDGLYVGEQQAIGLLKDYSLEVNEPFDGFTLTKFDGERVRISNGKERTA